MVIVPPMRWIGLAHLSEPNAWPDIVKLLALTEIGGIAMDCDVIVARNADDLASRPFSIGVQAGIPGGRSAFGNSFMAARRGSAFATKWLRAYRGFGARLGDLNRDYFAMHLPMELYARTPNEACVLRHEQLYFPIMYRSRDFLFNDARAVAYESLIGDQYAVPLWPEFVGKELEEWTPEDVVKRDCVYARLCRQALAALPSNALVDIAGRLGLSADALIRSTSGTSVAQPIGAEGTS